MCAWKGLSALVWVCWAFPQNADRNEIGRIFDIDGEVVILSPDGTSTELDRERDILRPVYDGDLVLTKEDGRVLIVSNYEDFGHEILAQSKAEIRDGKIFIFGKFKRRPGLKLPVPAQRGKAMGGVVLRGDGCIELLSPANTTIIAISPELKWKATCGECAIFYIKIHIGETVVFHSETAGHQLRLPEGILKFGVHHQWMVYGELGCGTAHGTFYVPTQHEIKRLRAETNARKVDIHDLPHFLSYIGFLLENDLKELARHEIDVLTARFPKNPHFASLELH